ncbi:hypothetical protein BDV3_004343 [Batrachochytrium dendrobatidis]
MTTSPSPFYYSPEELAELLEKRGIDVQTDGFIRCTNTCIIRRLVQRMGLPYYTCATALYMYHRFVARYSISDNQQEDVILACVSLAMKAEETVKRLRDLYIMIHSIIHETVIDPDSKIMNEVRDHVMNYERMILEDMQFELCIRHAHHFVLAFNDKLVGTMHTAQKGWRVAGDSYTTTVCIQYPPHIIALAAVYIAGKLNNTTPSPSLLDSDWLRRVYCRLSEIKGAIVTISEELQFSLIPDEMKERYRQISSEVKNMDQSSLHVKPIYSSQHTALRHADGPVLKRARNDTSSNGDREASKNDSSGSNNGTHMDTNGSDRRYDRRSNDNIVSHNLNSTSSGNAEFTEDKPNGHTGTQSSSRDYRRDNYGESSQRQHSASQYSKGSTSHSSSNSQHNSHTRRRQWSRNEKGK